MGPVNWIGVIVAACAASAVLWAFARKGGWQRAAAMLPPLLISSAMLGHNFARIGAEVLAAKPWLYWMQSGGLAIAFIAPVLWISYGRRRLNKLVALNDAGEWLLAFLAMGTVFWALG